MIKEKKLLLGPRAMPKLAIKNVYEKCEKNEKNLILNPGTNKI